MIDFSIGYLFTSLVAGAVTVLAPCILPLLPVIIGSSTSSKSIAKPLRIIFSLSVSIIVFTLLLKASTALIGIDPAVWKWLSGGILLIFGLFTLFPEIWEKLSLKLNLNASSNKLLGKAMKADGYMGDILIGAALGPIFTSCSPTYGTIVGTVIPESYATGFIYLIVYVIGLMIPLMLIAFFGQKATTKLAGLSDPKGLFKRIIGVIFIIVGIAIITGIDKQVETWIIDNGLGNLVNNIEQWIGGDN